MFCGLFNNITMHLWKTLEQAVTLRDIFEDVRDAVAC